MEHIHLFKHQSLSPSPPHIIIIILLYILLIYIYMYTHTHTVYMNIRILKSRTGPIGEISTRGSHFHHIWTIKIDQLTRTWNAALLIAAARLGVTLRAAWFAADLTEESKLVSLTAVWMKLVN